MAMDNKQYQSLNEAVRSVVQEKHNGHDDDARARQRGQDADKETAAREARRKSEVKNWGKQKDRSKEMTAYNQGQAGHSNVQVYEQNIEMISEYLSVYFGDALNEGVVEDDDIMEALEEVLETADAVAEYLNVNIGN